jgi:hypothetical protein
MKLKKGGMKLKKIFSSSAERKISQKNPEYILNYSLPCSYINI